MSGVPSLPGVPGVRLALPLWPRGRGGPASYWPVALGLVLLVLTVLAGLVATGRIGLAGAESATAAPVRQVAPSAAAREAELARAKGQRRAALLAAEARPATERVVDPTQAETLFARHSWAAPPPPPRPPPPPAPEPPPPEPTAPPFPYAFVGSFAPEGDRPVFFLAKGDRVIDAHVGDRLDGVYQFESAAGGQLVFVYMPLNIRQNLTAGASR
jgi:hypothetical protein